MPTAIPAPAAPTAPAATIVARHTDPVPAATASTSSVPIERATAPGGYLASMTRDHGFEPLRVEGRLPESLRGTLVRNGPGLHGSFDTRYEHPFEGDGALAAVRLDGRTALGAHRLIESEGLLLERAAGKPLFGSAASWLRRLANNLRLRDKNTANTSVVAWQGRLFALQEASMPTEIDPETLATLGERDLDGAVVQTFSAHPHDVRSRRTLYGFGQRLGRHADVDVFALPDEGPARRIGGFRLPHGTMLHDFAVTDRHLVFIRTPVRLRLFSVFTGARAFTDYFRWNPRDGAEVIIVPIDAPTEIRRFPIDPFFVWHFANAFERGSEIVLDLIRYDDFHSFTGLRDDTGITGTYHRGTLDPARSTLRVEQVWDGSCEFPIVDPRLGGTRHEVSWAITERGPVRRIARLEPDRGAVRTFAFEPWQRPSEALFVPRAADGREDDGWLLTLVYDERTLTSHLAVFDAPTFEDGPIARAHFDHHVPMTFHGKWLAGR